MIAIGLVLLVLSLIVGAGVLLANDQSASASAFGLTLDGTTLGTLMLIGAAIGAVAVLGLWLMVAGAARRRLQARGHREAVEREASERETLAEQNARLQAELASTREREARPEPVRPGADRTEAQQRPAERAVLTREPLDGAGPVDSHESDRPTGTANTDGAGDGATSSRRTES